MISWCMFIKNSILTLVFGYIAGALILSFPVELENINSTYAQSNIDKQVIKNNISSVDLQCFDRPCSAEADGTTGAIDAENSTALIGISFKDVPLEIIRENKEMLKATAGSYLNATIDAVAAGNIVTQTRCLPLDNSNGLPQTGASCPIIDGIVIPSADETAGP
jgi:hypothetical protein